MTNENEDIFLYLEHTMLGCNGIGPVKTNYFGERKRMHVETQIRVER
jgi:hypothetical protein